MVINHIDAGDAAVAGQARRISAAEKLAQAEALTRMQAGGGTLTAAIEIKRAATGVVERHTLVFTPAHQRTESDQREA